MMITHFRIELCSEQDNNLIFKIINSISHEVLYTIGIISTSLKMYYSKLHFDSEINVYTNINFNIYMS